MSNQIAFQYSLNHFSLELLHRSINKNIQNKNIIIFDLVKIQGEKL